MNNTSYLWKLTDITVDGINRDRLSNLSLEIPPGVTALLGWSGAGKSSLIQLLTGSVDYSSGTIESNIPEKTKAPCPLFIVPQDFGLWPRINVIDHLLKSMPAENKEKALQLLESFDLKDKSLNSVDTLSQGECSRLAIARALATEAQVILMDEPLANIDSSRKSKYWDIIQNYAQQGRSIIFSTHDYSEALAYSENTICLHEGKFLAQGKTTEIYYNPADKITSELMGPGNWLNTEEFDRSFCRPEELNIEESPDGKYEIIKSISFGQTCKTTLEKDGIRENFFHCPPRPLIEKMKVTISLLLFLILVSCTPSSQSSLEFKSVTSWNTPADGQRLPGPRAVSPGLHGNVIVLDDAGRLLVYDKNGTEIKRWPMPATELGHPEGATVFADGRIAVADTHYARVVVFDKEGKVDFTFGKSGVKEGDFYSPVGISLDDKENIYVCEYGKNDRIQKFTKEGKFIKAFGQAGTGPGELQRASDLIWHNGLIYIADAVNNRVQIFTDEGEFVKILADKSSGLYMPYDIDISPDGHLYIAEYGNSRITKITLEGEVIGRFGSPGTELNQFKTPWGIAVSDDGIIYVADTGNRRITRLEK